MWGLFFLFVARKGGMMAIQVPKIIELDTGEIEINITITVKPKKQQVEIIVNPVDIAEDIKREMKGILSRADINLRTL